MKKFVVVIFLVCFCTINVYAAAWVHRGEKKNGVAVWTSEAVLLIATNEINASTSIQPQSANGTVWASGEVESTYKDGILSATLTTAATSQVRMEIQSCHQ